MCTHTSRRFTLSLLKNSIFLETLLCYNFSLHQSLPSLLGARSETSGEATVRSNLVGNAGSRPISEAKQPWACPVLGWGTTGEAHVLYSFLKHMAPASLRSARADGGGNSGQVPEQARGCVEWSLILAKSESQRISARLTLDSAKSFRVSLVFCVGWQWSA